MAYAVMGSRRRACRCRVCGARQMLAKHPDEYVNRRRCRQCGRFDTLRIDRWADRRGWRAQTCYCDGLWFPHRHGSKGCRDHVERVDWPPPDSLYAGDEPPF